MGMFRMLFFWGMVRVIRIVADRPSARSVTRTTREQIPATGPHDTIRSQRLTTIRRRAKSSRNYEHAKSIHPFA
jgi:hypothetical protein